jgi:hypothetical protein
MPQVLGQNDNGTWNVQTDDGRQVTTAYLPPGLAAGTPAPAEQMAALTGLGAPAPSAGGTSTMAPLPTEVVSGWLAAGAPAAPPPAPVAPGAAQQLTQDVLGTPRPKGLEFNGFRGDPAVPMRNGEMLGHTQGYAARSDIGGAAPAAPTQAPALRPVSDFIDLPPGQSATAQQTASALVPVPFSGAAPGDMKAMNAAFAQQAKGVQAAADAAAQGAAAEAAVYDVQAQAARQRALQDSERRQAVTQGVDDAVQTYSSLVSELTTPSGQLDPGRWWKDRTTGQKIAAYASSFLTGFAGRPDAIQQAIDRDLEAQKDTLDRMDRAKMQRLGASQGLVGMMRDRFSDTLLAQNAARLAAAEYEEKETKAAAARAQGPQAQAAAQVRLGEIAERKAKYAAEMRERAAQLAMARYEAQLKLQQQAAAQQAQSGAVVPLASLTPELLKRAVVVAPGQAVLALDPDSAGKVRALQTGYKDASGLISEMIALRKNYGGETLNQDAVRTGKGLRSSFLLTLKNLEQTGALDKGTVEIVEPMIPEDPLEWKMGTTALMESTLNTVRGKFTNAFMTFTGRASPDMDNSVAKKDAKPAK